MNYPQEASIAGAWTGHWESTANGHHGALRCLITAKENHRYQAWYAKYLKWFSYSYKVEMVVDPLDPLLTFHGQADLGTLAGGEYHSLQSGLRATYQARKDHGIFFKWNGPGRNDLEHPHLYFLLAETQETSTRVFGTRVHPVN